MRKREIICHSEEYDSLVRMLASYQRAGVYLTLGGRPASPRELANVCVSRESSCYMSDFIPDERGQLREIRFDKVKIK